MSNDLQAKICTPCRGWGWAKVLWQTKKIKGLHENDFIMAAKTNELPGASGVSD